MKKQLVALFVAFLLSLSACSRPDIPEEPPEEPQQEEKQESVRNITVYVTDTGSKYHRSDCRYLYSKNEISLSRAKREGYTPCSVCNAPKY